MGAWVLVVFASCHRNHAPAPKISAEPASPSPQQEAVTFIVSEGDVASRLALQIMPGEFTLAPPPGIIPVPFPAEGDARDSLHNLAIAPEDIENGWNWAWEVFCRLPAADRPGFIDEVASLTPPWAWDRLDPILRNPAWGSGVLQLLWQRLLDLPLELQWPRVLEIARNPSHPCRDQADSLLQTYFPEVPTGSYEIYQRRISPLPPP